MDFEPVLEGKLLGGFMFNNRIKQRLLDAINDLIYYSHADGCYHEHTKEKS